MVGKLKKKKRTVGGPPTRLSTAPPLLWGPEGVKRRGSTLILLALRHALDHRVKVMGRQV